MNLEKVKSSLVDRQLFEEAAWVRDQDEHNTARILKLEEENYELRKEVKRLDAGGLLAKLEKLEECQIKTLPVYLFPTE